MNKKDFELLGQIAFEISNAKKDIVINAPSDKEMSGKLLRHFNEEFSCGLFYALQVKQKLDFFSFLLADTYSYEILFHLLEAIKKAPEETSLLDIEYEGNGVCLASPFEDTITETGHIVTFVGL
jgi:hypothetical protein